MTEITFRHLTKNDAPDIHKVALAAWLHTYRGIFDQSFIENFVNRNYAPEMTVSLLPQIRMGTMFFDVAQHGSQVVGFCNIGVTERGAELFRIYLFPDYIGKGLGSRLLQRGEAFVIGRGLHTCFCFVHKDNELGKQFYLRSGFYHIADKDHDSEWYMEKML